VDDNVNPVQIFPVRIVVLNVSVPAYFIKRVLFPVLVKIDDETGTGADNLAVVFDTKLPFGKDADVAFIMLPFKRDPRNAEAEIG